MKKIYEIITEKIYPNFGCKQEHQDYISTGFKNLDSYIEGLHKGNLIYLGARPAMGKTSFALSLAENFTIKEHKKCIYFSLDMTCKQLAKRILSSLTAIPISKIHTENLTDNEWLRFGNASQKLNDVELFIEDFSDDKYFGKVSKIKEITQSINDIDCIIIDHFNLIQADINRENRRQEYTDISRQLKLMAKEFNIPVICLGALNRKCDSRKFHRPKLADVRGCSGTIEIDADVIMFLYRDDYYYDKLVAENKEINKTKQTELIIAKNRNGDVGTLELEFDAETGRFSELKP